MEKLNQYVNSKKQFLLSQLSLLFIKNSDNADFLKKMELFGYDEYFINDVIDRSYNIDLELLLQVESILNVTLVDNINTI